MNGMWIEPRYCLHIRRQLIFLSVETQVVIQDSSVPPSYLDAGRQVSLLVVGIAPEYKLQHCLKAWGSTSIVMLRYGDIKIHRPASGKIPSTSNADVFYQIRNHGQINISLARRAKIARQDDPGQPV